MLSHIVFQIRNPTWVDPVQLAHQVCDHMKTGAIVEIGLAHYRHNRDVQSAVRRSEIAVFFGELQLNVIPQGLVTLQVAVR